MTKPRAGGRAGGGMRPVVRPDAGAKAVSPARAAAFHILEKVGWTAAHSDDLLHSVAVNALRPEDRNLMTALVMGVLRWELWLDERLAGMLERPDAELHGAALLALRMGLFQLLMMDRVPAHAAINESVELARANGAAHAAGMVNAVLGRAAREKDAAVERKTLAVKLTPAEMAHPAWLLARWRAAYGAVAARKIAEYDQAEPAAHGLFEADATLPEIDDGSRLVAEIAATAVVGPRRILDCCAAPGGKTAVLAVRHPEAEIVAADVSEKRLAAMRRRMDRSPETARVKTVVADMTAASAAPVEEFEGGFDLILCDAPCSGTGTLARNPEIRHRLRESDLARQAERQIAILTNAAGLLRPGGLLVYSTCSLEAEENAAVLEAAGQVAVVPVGGLVSGLGLRVDADSMVSGDVLRTLPGVHPCDGFFAAVLERRD